VIVVAPVSFERFALLLGLIFPPLYCECPMTNNEEDLTLSKTVSHESASLENTPSEQNPFANESAPSTQINPPPPQHTSFAERVKGFIEIVKGLNTEQWLWIVFGVSCFLTLVGIWKWIVLTLIALPIAIITLHFALKARNSRKENTQFDFASEAKQSSEQVAKILAEVAKKGKTIFLGLSSEQMLWIATAVSGFVFVIGILTWTSLAWIAASAAMFLSILAALERSKRIENELEAIAVRGDTRALYDLADRYYRQGKPGKLIRLFARVVAESENHEVALSKLEAYVDSAKFPDAPDRNAALTLIYTLVQKKNTIAGYADYYSKYPDAPNRNKVLEDMYKLIREINTIAVYTDYCSNFPNAPNLNTVLADMYKLIKEKNTIADFADYYSKYPGASNRNEALTDMYKLIKKINKIPDYADYYFKYPGASNRNEALTDMYQLIKKIDLIAAYVDYYFKYPDAPNLGEVLTDIYELVKPEKNVARYYWFLVTFPGAPQEADALMRMYTEMFRIAQQINTVEALNDFVFACPLAREVDEACSIANRLEKELYTPTDSSNRDEKDEKAWTLATKLLGIWQEGEPKSPAQRLGYELVVKRMLKLLEMEFLGQEATYTIKRDEAMLRYQRELSISLGNMEQWLQLILGAIHQNIEQTEELKKLIWQQTVVINHHFGIMGNTLQSISYDTQVLAEQMPSLVDTANRQAKSLEYANGIAKQFSTLLASQRDETEKLRIAVEK